MLTQDQNAASVDLRLVSSKAGSPLVRNSDPKSCRWRAMIKMGIPSERALNSYRHGNLHMFSA